MAIKFCFNLQITFHCQQLCSHFVKLLRIMRARGRSFGKLLSIKCLRSKPARYGDVHRDTRSPLQQWPNKSVLCLVLAPPSPGRKCRRRLWWLGACCLSASVSSFAFSYSPANHIQIQIVGVALSRHLLTAPLAALMIHSASEGKRNPRRLRIQIHNRS